MGDIELVEKARAGDEWAKEDLIRKFEGMAYKYAKNYNQLGEDRYVIALEAIWRAVLSYDPTKAALSTHIGCRIKGALMEAARPVHEKMYCVNRRGKPLARDAWSLDAYPGNAELIQDRVNHLEELEVGGLLQQIDTALKDDRLKRFLAHLLDDGSITEFGIKEGISQSRAWQLRKQIIEIVAPLRVAA